MKKLILSVLVALCAVCLSVAVACKKEAAEPKYYILMFEKVDGITYNCEIPNGYEVREGETITFSVTYSDDVEGTPAVMANDNRLTADESGKYSFKMNSDTTVTVSGTFVLNKYLVTFDKGDPDGDEYRLTYHSDDGDVENGFTVSAGEKVSFTVDMSVYYDTSRMKVLANTTILIPDSNGVYTFTVNSKTNVSITEITLAQWFGEKENGGSGTKEDPYLISEPIDLYELSALVKDQMVYGRYYSAYYKLEKDIDLKGEQLFIIGDSETYPFAGHFDGNGKTISNFYIEDTLIDQETYVTYHTPFVGMFGCVSATPNENGAAEIYNLKLDNFTIEADAGKGGNALFAGGIVGWGYGVNITGCETTNGTIMADADDNYFGYIGGIIGNQISVYQSASVNFISVVNACSSSVDIVGTSGYIFAAGGISGVVTSSDPRVTAAVINSYSTGSVSGAMYTGGIVGRVGSYSTVQGCYSTGFVEARNSIGLITGSERYAYAYAGGIAGYVDNDAAVTDCFSLSQTYANSDADASGTYSYTDDIACGWKLKGAEDSSVSVEATPAVVWNSYSAKDNINKDLILNRLKWHDQDWTFVNGSDLPLINKSENGTKAFTLKFNLGNKEKYNSSSELTVNINSIYMPIALWNINTDGIDAYGFINADSGNRSYGVYFDAELKEKVPYGYIPINSETLYVGFADYSEVAGDYYFKNADDVYISLNADGSLIFTDGALRHVSYYSYDGAELTLYDTFIGIAFDNEEVYTSYKAEFDEGVLSIYDNDTHPQTNAIIALKAADNINYGKYYGTNGTVYSFNKNGSGTAVKGTQTVNFTYKITVSGLIVEAGSNTYTCPVDADGNVTAYNGDTLMPFDKFLGVWEKSAGSKKQYSFDGKGLNGNGTYTVITFGYDKDGKKVNETTSSGNYTINSDGELEFNGLKVGFNQDGFLEIGGELYYRENSFTGVWNFFNTNDPVEITLNGIGADGVGLAFVDYGDYGSYIASYSASTDANGNASITLFYYDLPLGVLSYQAGNNTLTGSLYLARNGDITQNATFFLYDDYKGVWISDVIELIEFNGLGNYAVKGNESHMAVSGSIKINGEAAGSYTLVNSTLTGSFVYDGVTYNVAYDEENGLINVNYDGGNFDFIKHDKMYGLDLQDDSGLVYSFDGRGNLSSGGKLTVTDTKNGNATTDYNYKFNNAGNIDISGTATGTLTIGSVYTLNLNGTKTLTVVNGFTGSWTGKWFEDNKVNKGELVIGKINADMKAQGSVFGNNTEFTYSADGNYLTYNISGQTYYIDVAQSDDGVTELIISSLDDIGGVYAVCVSARSIDSFEGRYNATGTDNYLKLDGFGNAKFVSGTAERYENGELIQTYSYTVGRFGLQFTYGNLRYLFVECSAGDDGAYEKDGAYRKLVQCDTLFGYTAYLTKLSDDGKFETDKNVSFEFNGIGTLTCSDGKVYSYKIDSRDRVNMYYVLTLELASSDTKLRAVVRYGGETDTIELGECDTAPTGTFTDKDGVTYSFDGMSNLSVGGAFYVTSGGTVTQLTYKITDGEIVIYNANGTNYGKLVSSDGSYKIILANNSEIILTAAE